MNRRLAAPFTAVAVLLALGAGCSVEEEPAAVKSEGKAEVVDEADSADADTEAEAEEEDEALAETASLGDTVVVGNWEVKIAQVALNANEAMKRANQFNDKPKGVYVLATYEATYTGPERTADTMMDLSWSFTTTDSQIHDQAYQVTPADNESWPTEARSGGTVKGQVVFDLDPKQVKGGLLTVETYDENFDLVYADFTV